MDLRLPERDLRLFDHATSSLGKWGHCLTNTESATGTRRCEILPADVFVVGSDSGPAANIRDARRAVGGVIGDSVETPKTSLLVGEVQSRAGLLHTNGSSWPAADSR